MSSRFKNWILLALLGALLVAYFFVYLKKTFEIGITETADWGHVLAIVPISAWWIYSLVPELETLELKRDWRGFGFFLAGLVAYGAGLFPIQNGMFQGIAFALTFIGLVWFLLGIKPLRVLLPPLVFLLFTIRVSDRLWELTTARLQDFAASGAAIILKICTLAIDFDVQIEGNLIRLFYKGETLPLNVAEACSGIRSLMAFMALGFLLAWIAQGKALWQRIGLTLLAAPVAIVVNIGRVTTLGLLTLINPKLAQGDFHILVGLLMLIPAAGLLLGCGWIMEKLVTEEKQKIPLERTPRAGKGIHNGLTNVRTSPCLRAGLFALMTLSLALIGQQAYLYSAHVVLFKLPLPLRQDLHQLPKTLGAWNLEQEEPPESAEVEHALGTKNYITRWYTRADNQKARLHLAYYTGALDTVPHVPDRCFVAAGAKPLEKSMVKLGNIPATLFHYQSASNGSSTVLYFFSSNGQYLATPDEVRLQGFRIGDKYGYYCKIEMEFVGLQDEQKILEAGKDFTGAALPSILNCLPAWPPMPTP